MVMAALVIDLGQLRSTRREEQLIADFAAKGAGKSLSNGDPQAACIDAWRYIVENTKDLPASVTSNSIDCSPLGTAGACSNTTPQAHDATFSTSTSPYTATVRYPVPDD